ncbi:hypothetical protein GE253_19580 [Niveispirillum sp. SYP-B3756]|uniref:hypothetical protein n=1 Tax=Niveispirillum sp. SYP-B3756 TaxID=2662178 RepID=UPI001291FC24|nr:hypothetical protein [Niveispirillum sp. SYP-B3756]MQP67532.1 hypothetical protein [Niveispirillum sp. SYP-B3756]
MMFVTAPLAPAPFYPGDEWLRDLIAAPGDQVQPVGPTEGDRALFVVLHRSRGLWTHIYRVQRQPGRSGGLVALLRVLEGDQVEQAVRWANGMA